MPYELILKWGNILKDMKVDNITNKRFLPLLVLCAVEVGKVSIGL